MRIKMKDGRLKAKPRRNFGRRKDRSVQVFYDPNRQCFPAASSSDVKIVKEALVQLGPDARKENIVIPSDRITVAKNTILVHLPFTLGKVDEKWGKLLIRGKKWNVHLKLKSDSKSSLNGGRTQAGKDQPGPGTSREGLEARMKLRSK